jgi:glutathione S-transferase
MKLYYAPGACSLADHIALIEAGFEFDLERVDLKLKTTASGGDFTVISGKGYVPALVLDNGEKLTENIAVLDWIAAQNPALGLDGDLGRTRLVEALAYIATELHKNFKPFFTGGSEVDKSNAQVLIIRRLRWLADQTQGRYLFGNQPTVADFYLFVMLRWAAKFGIAVPDALTALHERMLERPGVKAALAREEKPAKQSAAA